MNPKELYIRTSTSVLAKNYTSRSNKLTWRTLLKHRVYRSRKRLVRIGLFSANALVVGGILLFVLHAPMLRQTLRSEVSSGDRQEAIIGPLDQLSSADIAVNVARMTRLAETASVTNHADSVNAQLTSAQSEELIVSKPIIASAPLPSKRDIRSYVVKPGDTIASIANANGISSESVKWSNNLVTNNVTVGSTLYLPPSGVNGIVYTVKQGDTPENLARKYNTTTELVTAFNDAEVSGLVVGERVLIPNGTIVAPRPTYSGFAFGASAKWGYNGYDYGWCTWYAANRRSELGRPVPANFGNARTWYILAQRAGLPTGLAPAPGAVAVNQSGNHVSVVEVVNPDGSFIISEMNSSGYKSIDTIGNDAYKTGGWAVRDYKLYTSVGNLKFIY